jgi:sugar phosphate isomerase/epimerase
MTMEYGNISRRNLIKAGVLAAAAVPLAGGGGEALAAGAAAAAGVQGNGTPPEGWDRFRGLKVGVATYTFHKKSLEEAIAGTRRVGVAYCSIKSSHLPLESSAEQRKAVVAKFKAAGITPLSCGNISMRTEAEARQAFEYARDAGIPTIVCAPVYDVLPALDKLVKEFDIKIAIHNHGPEDKWFPSPLDVWERVKGLDPRVGLCVDVGHCARAGVEPQEAILKCRERVYDCHMKDIVKREPHAKVTEVGRGVLDIPAVVRALLEIKMEGHVGFEYEKNFDDPVPGVAEGAGYVRGVVATMPA